MAPDLVRVTGRLGMGGGGEGPSEAGGEEEAVDEDGEAGSTGDATACTAACCTGAPSPPVAQPPAVLVEGETAGYRHVRSHKDQSAGAQAVLELAPVVEKLAPALVEAPGKADCARGWRDRRPRVR
jgi:hypothetical protein